MTVHKHYNPATSTHYGHKHALWNQRQQELLPGSQNCWRNDSPCGSDPGLWKRFTFLLTGRDSGTTFGSDGTYVTRK